MFDECVFSCWWSVFFPITFVCDGLFSSGTSFSFLALPNWEIAKSSADLSSSTLLGSAEGAGVAPVMKINGGKPNRVA